MSPSQALKALVRVRAGMAEGSRKQSYQYTPSSDHVMLGRVRVPKIRIKLLQPKCDAKSLHRQAQENRDGACADVLIRAGGNVNRHCVRTVSHTPVKP